MRINHFPFKALLIVAATVVVIATQSVRNLQVTLRGKKYDVPDATTVKDLMERVEEASGIERNSQGRVLFGGKRLEATDVLSQVGVTDGSLLNIVPSTMKAKSSKKGSSKSASASASSREVTKSDGGGGGGGSEAPSDPMKEYLKMAGIDTNQLDELMKNMGGAGGNGDGSMPSMEEGVKMMHQMMNSPIFKEYMNDPEKLEESRKMILSNPMLKSMLAGMPGMEDLLKDPVAWRQAMQGAAQLYTSMDSDQIVQAMKAMSGDGDGNGGAGAAGMMGGMGMPGGLGGGMPGGLFDGMAKDPSMTTAALDELDEDD